MQKLFLFACILISSVVSHAQYSRYIIRFSDKGSNPFSIVNPSAYLSAKAIERRIRYNIAIDSTDLPVTPRYIDSVRLAGNVTILNISKWLNQIAIRTTDVAALAKIRSFPFVISADEIATREIASLTVNKFLLEESMQNNPTDNRVTNTSENFYNYGRSFGQIRIHQTQFLHNHGFRGEGMLMTVLDAGFFRYTTLPTFDSIRNNGQVLGTWDFVANETSVDEDNSHGMQCLSTIAANIPGVFVGSAPKTSFYLYRTEEVATEFPIEEQNWAAGMERSDSIGVDITSTSLGYTTFDRAQFNHTYADMDGNTTIAARAADFAAKKGMMVVVAAGNEGNSSWRFISTPADADSAVAVGAVDTLGNVAGFSGYGPSSDGQIKPEMASVGLNSVVANTSSGAPTYSNGTSFACPNLAGVITCLWQAFPEVNNVGIINAMKASATKFNNPDARGGYGIPDAKKSFVLLLKQSYQQSIQNNNCRNEISFSVKSDASMPVTVERKLQGENDYSFLTTLTTTGNFIKRDFNYTDNVSGLSGTIQYRLKMDIAADTTFYLDSLSVLSPDCLPSNDSISIRPNPVKDILKVQFTRTTDVNYTLILHNSAGQKVFTKSGIQRAGVGEVNVPMIAMSRGIYYLTVILDNKKIFTKKILRY